MLHHGLWTALASAMMLCALTGLAASDAHADEDGIRVILDTDANNEIDDQHAIAYMLFNRDVFDVEGVTVNATRGGGEVQQHYDEAARIVTLCGLEDVIDVYLGANGDFEDIRPNLDEPDFDGHEAVHFIIERAMADDDRELVLLPIGKLTNIALALEKEPDIADNVRIVWLGSNYPRTGEYNMENDRGAVQYLLDADVRFEIATVRYGEPSGTDAVRATLEDIRENMPGVGPKIDEPITGRHGGEFDTWGDYSVNLFENYNMSGDPPARPLFDMAAAAIVKNPDWAESTTMPAPALEDLDDGGWVERPDNPREITLWEHFDREAIMADFYSPPYVDAGEPTHYDVRLVLHGRTPTVGAGSEVRVDAWLRDEDGNPVQESGREVNWSASNGGSFSSSQTSTDEHGRASVTFTVSSEAEVEHVITATDDADNTLTGESPVITAISLEAAGLIAFYPFDESGGAVSDQSGYGQPLDLEMAGNVEWIEGEEAVLLDGGYLRNKDSARKLFDRITTTGRFTIEAWIKPSEAVQEGPGRIVSYSNGTTNRNFTLGHGHYEDASNNLEFRVRTTDTNNNGEPSLDAEANLTTDLQHVAVTYNGSTVRVYRDGSEILSEQRGGTFDNWDAGHQLLLGAEAGGERTWAGELHQVAIYDRDLSSSEVSDNHDAGMDGFDPAE
ncbi:MAG: LamG-like jellyroll fold domain-containing protein [Candidatus Hydrogenedentota bacterium]